MTNVYVRAPRHSRTRLVRALSAVLFVAVLAGCASVPHDAGFDEVRATSAERTGVRVHWNRGGPEDEAVAQSVQVMLQDTLTADEATQIALLNNRRLQATYEALGIAQANLMQAGLLRNPVFSTAVLFPNGGGQAELSLGVAQDFLSVFFLPLRRQLAEAEFEAAKLRVTGAVIELAAEAKSAFYRVQADQQMLELLRQVLDATAAEFDAAQRLHAAGNITDLTLATQRTLFEDARLALAGAEANLAVDRERLNAVMGLWGAATAWKTDPRLPEIPDQPSDFTDLEKRAISASLDLAAARNQAVVVARQLGLAYASIFLQPLELGVEFEREEGAWERGPTLEVPLPIFDFGRARRVAARATLRQFQQTYEAQAIEIRTAVRAAAQALAAARARSVHVTRVLLPLRTQIVEQTQLQYNAMQVGLFQLLLAKREQIAAGLQFIESLRDYWLARTQLERILNGRTSDIVPVRFINEGFEAPAVSGRSGLEMPGVPGRAETGGH